MNGNSAFCKMIGSIMCNLGPDINGETPPIKETFVKLRSPAAALTATSSASRCLSTRLCIYLSSTASLLYRAPSIRRSRRNLEPSVTSTRTFQWSAAATEAITSARPESVSCRAFYFFSSVLKLSSLTPPPTHLTLHIKHPVFSLSAKRLNPPKKSVISLFICVALLFE